MVKYKYNFDGSTSLLHSENKDEIDHGLKELWMTNW